MTMKKVPRSWSKGVVMVCTHERSPESGRVSCTKSAGGGLRGWLKDCIREEGLRGEILAVTTGCQGVCPANGVTVCLARAQAVGDAEMLIVDPAGDREALWGKVVALARMEEG